MPHDDCDAHVRDSLARALSPDPLSHAKPCIGAVTPSHARPLITTPTGDSPCSRQLMAGGAVAMVHSVVAAVEIVHHGDPPTGVIESLPGMLIITQSQAAHREIKELLDELSEGQ